MEIISHRGVWGSTEEQNTLSAFERSLDMNFGIETDIRDYGSKIVISHNMPKMNCLRLEDLLDLYKKCQSNTKLALNIKSDGLQSELKKLLHEYHVSNYFTFDMSVPDALGHIKENINSFTRQSEYEKQPAYYDNACGVWLDEFIYHWITIDTITSHDKNGKSICIVSPELHHRSHTAEWKDYLMLRSKSFSSKIMLCTDYPQEAKRYFNE